MLSEIVIALIAGILFPDFIKLTSKRFSKRPTIVKTLCENLGLTSQTPIEQSRLLIDMLRTDAAKLKDEISKTYKNLHANNESLNTPPAPGVLGVIPTEGIYCIETENGWVYTTADGKPLVNEVFTYGEPMREGRAEVSTSDGWGVIDKQGHFVMPPMFEELHWDDYNNVIMAMEFGKWNVYDRNGQRLTKRSYQWLGEYNNGLCLAQRGGKCGFINLAGEMVIQPVWDDASGFSSGRATVYCDNKPYTIDTSGKIIK